MKSSQAAAAKTQINSSHISTRGVHHPYGAPAPQKGITKLFSNLFNALGIHEQQPTTTSEDSQEPGDDMVVAAPPAPTVSPPKPQYCNGYLGPIHPADVGQKCLVLDLDETLVHSSFRPTENPDFIIPVDIDGMIHNVYVLKRPGVDEFLRVLAQTYEIVVFTASLSKYANPLLDQMDVHKVIRHRLFREHCVQYEGNYIKDLSVLDRDLSQTIIIDNSAMSYLFHPQNAIGCSNFIDDLEDQELASIQEFLVDIAEEDDVRQHLMRWTPETAHQYIVG